MSDRITKSDVLHQVRILAGLLGKKVYDGKYPGDEGAWQLDDMPGYGGLLIEEITHQTYTAQVFNDGEPVLDEAGHPTYEKRIGAGVHMPFGYHRRPARAMQDVLIFAIDSVRMEKDAQRDREREAYESEADAYQFARETRP